MVEPVDAGECGEFDVSESRPRPLRIDRIPLSERVETLDEGVAPCCLLRLPSAGAANVTSDGSQPSGPSQTERVHPSGLWVASLSISTAEPRIISGLENR